MEWYRKPRAPLVLGHELAGTVEKAGPGVERFRPGDRVVVGVSGGPDSTALLDPHPQTLCGRWRESSPPTTT